MRVAQLGSANRAAPSAWQVRDRLQHLAFAILVALGPVALTGCAGLVSGSSTTTPPPPSTLQITNVQVGSATVSTCQIVWTTNVPADSAVDYGTSPTYGSTTAVDPTMVTNHVATISSLAPAGTYYYQVRSTDSKSNHGQSGGHSFKTQGLTISGSLSPAAGGSGATVALTGAASASVTADGSGNYTFPGLANGTYTVAPTRAGYTFTPSTQNVTLNGNNAAGVNFTDTSSAVAPAITTQPAGQTVTAGQTATFTVAATGTTPLTYQWQKNSVNITGATAASYTTPATTTSDNGSTFRVLISNSVGSVTSGPATLSVTAAPVAPTITTQPASQTVTAGQVATFTVADTGTAPLSYQWSKNGANISAATSSSYTTPATTTSDNGSAFTVVVTNSAGSVTSGPATLTVNPAPVAPTITTQPASQTVTAGQTTTFTAIATGTAALSYQWRKNGANISGATSSSYTTPATTTSDNGSAFTVVVSNSAGTVTSSAATLTVNAAPVAPTITTQPASQTVTSGQTATFTVTASGTPPLTYQWQRNGASIAGATSATYTTPATASSDNGATFAVIVSNTAGSVTSSSATLTVNPAPIPAIQLNPTSVAFGNAVVGISLSQALIIKNTGTATLTISQVTPPGSGFSVTGFSLPLNISAGQQATITVAFLPTATGSASGNISILSNAPTSPTSVALTGTGIAATYTLGISPASLGFGNITTGTSSAAQNILISDTGNSNVTISQITLTGTGYTMTGGSVPVTLSPSQSITLSVQFSPTVTGTANGSISIASNATGSPASISLTATGVAPTQHFVSLSWGASPSTVVGYNVYRSTVSGSLFARVNSSAIAGLAFTDSSVQSGTTYYYVATAVDAAGNESVFSNQVQAIVP